MQKQHAAITLRHTQRRVVAAVGAFGVVASLVIAGQVLPAVADQLAVSDTGTPVARQVADEQVVTEKQLAAVDHVVYAINAGNVDANTNNNPFAGEQVPYGIDRFDYPYETYVQDDITVSRPIVAFHKTSPFPDSLVRGAASDQEYAVTENLDWGYLPSTADNPTSYAAGPDDSWRSPKNDWPYFTGRKVDISSAAQAGALWSDPEYRESGGVVYRMEVPQRETGAPQEYTIRLGFWFEANNVRVAVDVNGTNRIDDQIVVGDVPHQASLKVTPDDDGIITVRVHTPQSVVDGGWVGDRSNARVNYLELAATPKYGDRELTGLLGRTQIRDLEPLASGVETGTYDSARVVGKDVAALQHARRDAVKALERGGSGDASSVFAAYVELEEAFNVRYVYHYTSIPGANAVASQFDTDGNRIQAHGGQIQAVGGTYYWVGEDKSNGVYPIGVHLYSSKDLYNWKSEGIVLETADSKTDYDAKVADPQSVFNNYAPENIDEDEDYQAVYGEDFRRFENDKWQYNIDSPQDVASLLEFDLNTEGYVVIERPKLVRNPDGRYVLWYHADGPTRGDPAADSYSKARAGVAISEGTDPRGPYKYLGSFRLDSVRSIDGPDDWDSGYGQSRDINLFVDEGVDKNDDGADDAYVVYTSDGNGKLYGALLNKTYTGLASWDACGMDTGAGVSCAQAGTDIAADATFNTLQNGQKEAPAPVKVGGKYYLMYSGTSGWVPNGGAYAVADNFLGPYTIKGNPASGLESESIFISQSSNIGLVDAGRGHYLYIGDQWFNPNHGFALANSRYVIQPVEFADGTMTIHRAHNWTTDVFDAYNTDTGDTD